MFYRHALRISLEYYKEGHPETAIMYANLGELLMHSCENVEGYEEENDPDSVEGGVSVEDDASAESGASVEARLAESRHRLLKYRAPRSAAITLIAQISCTISACPTSMRRWNLFLLRKNSQLPPWTIREMPSPCSIKH